MIFSQSHLKCPIIAVANQKGGVGKTTTSINLAAGLALSGKKALAIDLDPQGSLTQGLGLPAATLPLTIRDIIMDRSIPISNAIHSVHGLDVIGANPLLGGTARWMVTQTNGELRVKQRLEDLRTKYDYIILDSSPGLGPILNSALNAADYLLIPLDPGFFGYMGIQELRSEIQEIQMGSNPDLKVLGYLLTMMDRTVISKETYASLGKSFGEFAFTTQIRRCVGLREAPAFGQSIFQYAPKSTGAEDYLNLITEVIQRVRPSSSLGAEMGVAHV